MKNIVKSLLRISFLVLLFGCNQSQKTLNLHTDSVAKTKFSVDTNSKNKQNNVLNDSCSVDGHQLLLFSNGANAYLKIMGSKLDTTINLALSSPTFFIRKDAQQDILTYSYPQFAVQKLMMIAGGNLTDAEMDERGIDKKLSCGTHVQGLIWNDEKPSVTNSYLQNIKCKNQSSDEKEFYELAELFAKQ